LFAPQVNYAAYAFRSIESEVTPNYFAYGLGLTGGYSAAQIFDVAAQVFYYPSKLGRAQPFKEDAALFSYGAEIALRISASVYIGVRGGTYVYNLMTPNRAEEVAGRWTGPGGGLAVGAILPSKRDRSVQISLEAETAVVNRIDDLAPDDSPTRKLDLIKFRVSYVYNGINQLPMFDTFVGNLF
jgi:hypothetical protein